MAIITARSSFRLSQNAYISPFWSSDVFWHHRKLQLAADISPAEKEIAVQKITYNFKRQNKYMYTLCQNVFSS
jgi:G:T-mismatch repair DNA endonuclease (very short patch repair protein)